MRTSREIIMKLVTGAVIALALLGSTAAFAQQGAYRSGQQQIEIQNRNGEARDQNTRDEGRTDQANRSNEVRDNPHWSRGDKLPAQYRTNQYVVPDWKANHLRRPPRGYHWVRADNRYVLAGVVSGIVSDIIINGERGR
jgi:Ni/Co efflux regulator RcnB